MIFIINFAPGNGTGTTNSQESNAYTRANQRQGGTNRTAGIARAGVDIAKAALFPERTVVSKVLDVAKILLVNSETKEPLRRNGSGKLVGCDENEAVIAVIKGLFKFEVEKPDGGGASTPTGQAEELVTNLNQEENKPSLKALEEVKSLLEDSKVGIALAVTGEVLDHATERLVVAAVKQQIENIKDTLTKDKKEKEKAKQGLYVEAKFPNQTPQDLSQEVIFSTKTQAEKEKQQKQEEPVTEANRIGTTEETSTRSKQYASNRAANFESRHASTIDQDTRLEDPIDDYLKRVEAKADLIINARGVNLTENQLKALARLGHQERIRFANALVEQRLRPHRNTETAERKRVHAIRVAKAIAAPDYPEVLATHGPVVGQAVLN